MARMPGATWQPKAVGGRSARRKGRCVVYHVAVSEAQSLMPGPNADWHFYVARDGRIYQYIDTDLQAWANGAANASAISVETQGGVVNAQGEPWSVAQVKSLAAIARWANQTEGIPLRLMQNSRPEEKGLGWHRLGCDPWRVAGGELWSSARGKICPGDAKIAQMPDVLRQALNGAQPEDDVTPADIEAIAQRTRQVIADGQLPYGLDNLRRRLEALSAQVALADSNDAPQIVATAIVAALPEGKDGGLTVADVEGAVRSVLGALDA